MESRLPYELLAEIFAIYAFLPDTLPETLLQVCRSWNVVANNEPTLWTKFVISRDMIRSKNPYDFREVATLTHDWVGIFKRRLARAGPSLPLQVVILGLHELLLPVIDVVSGEAPGYVHLPRWETLNLETSELIRMEDTWGGTWASIASLISQPMPSLRRLTLQRNKIDFHAFPNAPNLEELDVLYSRSPLIGQMNSFPNLKKLRITYPTKYPLSLVHLAEFSLRSIETLIIGGEVDIRDAARGTYPSLSTLEFTERVPHGIASMSAPSLRHLILRNADLFCLIFPPPDGESQHANPQPKNRAVLGILACRFPTVEVLEVHENLRNLVLEMVFGGAAFFTGLKELWTVSKDGRERVDLGC
jgi:hypothetical protein